MREREAAEIRMLSVDELTARLRTYTQASARRDLQLSAVFGALLALGFLCALTLRNQPVLFRSAIVTWMLALAGLALYILGTTRAWHRQHGLPCPFCHRPLQPSSGILEDLVDGRPVPMNIPCPHCRSTIATGR